MGNCFLKPRRHLVSLKKIQNLKEASVGQGIDNFTGRIITYQQDPRRVRLCETETFRSLSGQAEGPKQPFMT